MGDSYRPGRSDRNHDRNRNRDRNRDRPLADRMTFTSGGGHDFYRPGEGHRRQEPTSKPAEFTFQLNRPAPQFLPAVEATGSVDTASRNQTSKRGRGGARLRNTRRDDFQESLHSGNRRRMKGPRGGPFRKAAAHERALLRQRDDASPEHTMGVSDGPNRFLNIEDLSDDEEEDMDLESDGYIDDDADGDDSPGRKKVARIETISRADGDSVPKWSNPDPYTVLPPPEETTGKKTDFVKLIRNAKNQAAEKAAGHNAVADNDDFISFNDDRKPGSPRSDDEVLYLGSRHKDGRDTLEGDDTIPLRGRRSFQGSMNDLRDHGPFGHGFRGEDQPDDANSMDDQPQRRARTNKRKQDSDIGIVESWLPIPNSDTTPWLRSTESYAHLSNDPDKWLHNEVLDFFEYVSPRSFEHDQRTHLIRRVNEALGPRLFGHMVGTILSFGSFPAGLYLPNADMDLVYNSEAHVRGRPAALDFSVKGAQKKILYRVADKLFDQRVSSGFPTVIAMAKVPIVKFHDRLTNLQVDISFENLSGLQAQATFIKWKRKYPDLEYMVVILKQFLAMRGLNEVHTGGIGGFSIICLVVAFLDNRAKATTFGECLLRFLDYYGNTFNLSQERIQMNPVGVRYKSKIGIDGRAEKPDGLSIQDPNRPQNNISGGSYRAKDAFKAFSLAHLALQNRMSAAEFSKNFGSSILECIIGGNYESYEKQRRHLESLPECPSYK